MKNALRKLRVQTGARFLARSGILFATIVITLGEPTLKAWADNYYLPGDAIVYEESSFTDVTDPNHNPLLANNNSVLTRSGNAVFIDDWRLVSGVWTEVHHDLMPITNVTNANPSPQNNIVSGALIASGVATSEGFLSVSADGQYVALTGYAVSLSPNFTNATNQQGDVSLPASLLPRVVGLINTATGPTGAGINTTTLVNDTVGQSIRSAVTTNGSDIWFEGAAGGVHYTTVGNGSGATAIPSTTQVAGTQGVTPGGATAGATNLRTISIFNGQLYSSQATGNSGLPTTVKIGTVGSGTPTTTGNVILDLPGLTNTSPLVSVNGYFMCTLGSDPTKIDTLYAAEDGALTNGVQGGGGIQKYSLVNGSWTYEGTIGQTADSYRGLGGIVNGTTVTLFATRNAAAFSTPNNTNGLYGSGQLITVADTAGTGQDFSTNMGANNPNSINYNPDFGMTVIQNNNSTFNLDGTINVDSHTVLRGVAVIPVPPAGRNLTWNGTDGSGSWAGATGWNNGSGSQVTQVQFNGGNPDNATFDATGIAHTTVTLDGATIVGSITFNAGNTAYTINPGSPSNSALTIMGAFGSGTAANSNATINPDVVLGANQSWSVGAGKTLTVNNISGSATLTKNGTGLLVISGTASQTGTNVNGGEVRLLGSLSGSGAVAVNSSAILSGTGTVTGTTTVGASTTAGGTVAPGAGTTPGTLTFQNGISFTNGGAMSWNLGALSVSNPGTDFSVLHVGGGAFSADAQSGLSIGFTNTATAPDTGNAFWNTARSWKVVDFGGTTSTGIFGTVSNGSYQQGIFTQSRSAGSVFLNFTPVSTAAAQSLVWDGAVTGSPSNTAGVWNATDSNWRNGGSSAVFNPFAPDNVTFGTGSGSGSVAISVGGPLSVGNVTFAANSPAYTISGGSLKTYGNITTNTSATITSPVSLQKAQTWSVATSQILAVSGLLSGIANLTKSGSGTLDLSQVGISNNTWIGKLDIQGGEVDVIDFNAPRASIGRNPVNIALGATLFGSAGVQDATTQFRIGEVTGSGTLISKFSTQQNGLQITTNADATFAGHLDVGDGNGNFTGSSNVTIRGIATQTFTGSVSGQNSPSFVSVSGDSAGLTLGGTMAFINNTNGNSVSLAGGTFTLDDSSMLIGQRLNDQTSSITGGGLFRYLGNAAGSSQLVGLLRPGSSALRVSVTDNTGSTAATTLTLTALSFSGGIQTTTVGTTVPLNTLYGTGTVDFENVNGTLGAGGNNPKIMLASGLTDVGDGSRVMGDVALVNGIIGRKGAVNTAGFATVNGTDFATYDSTNGIQAYTGYTPLTTATATSNAIVTATGAVSANQTVNSLKIAPTTSLQTLTINNGVTLKTLAILATGTQDFTIAQSGTGTLLDNGAARQIYVQQGRTLTIGAKLSNFKTALGDSPINVSGGGTLFLDGNTTQTFTETLRISGAGTTVRGVPGASLPTQASTGANFDLFDGVLELANKLPQTTVQTTVLGIGSGSGQVRFGGGGGFSAYNGPQAIDLASAGITNIAWELTNFVQSGSALIFGSTTATDRIELIDNLALNPESFDDTYNQREIRVLKNPSSTGDYARLSGNLSSSVYNDLLKTGSGYLELTNDNRTVNGGFNAGILAYEGTLLVGAANGGLGNAVYTLLGSRGGNADAALLTSAAGVTVDRDILVQAGSSGNTLSLGASNYTQAVSTGFSSTFSGKITLQNALRFTSGANSANNVTFSGTIDNSAGNAISVGNLGGTSNGTVTLTGSQLHGDGETLTVASGTLSYSLASNSKVSLGTTQKTITVNTSAALSVDATNLDPFTDSSTPANHVNVVNNSSAGFSVHNAAGIGNTTVGTVTGTGTTNVGTGSNGNGSLTATSIQQGALNIGSSSTPGAAKVTITASTPSSYVSQNTTVPSGNSAGTSILTSLSIANNGTGAYYGTLDLQNNNLVVNYSGASPVDDVRKAIQSAYTGGTWTGAGLTSSLMHLDAAGVKFALIYDENSNRGASAFDSSGNLFEGAPVADQSVLVKYSWIDDVNMDGVVNFDDLQQFKNNYLVGEVGKTYSQGDLNYDGVITFDDNQIFKNNYQNGGFAQLPEPSSFVLAGLGLLGLLFARRRRGPSRRESQE